MITLLIALIPTMFLIAIFGYILLVTILELKNK